MAEAKETRVEPCQFLHQEQQPDASDDENHNGTGLLAFSCCAVDIAALIMNETVTDDLNERKLVTWEENPEYPDKAK